MSKKPNRIQYQVTQCGQQLAGFIYPQKFKVLCPYCKYPVVCAKRHLKLITIQRGLYEAIDGFVIDQNWFSQHVQGRNKKYYCCSNCRRFLLGNGAGNGIWIDRFLIMDYDNLCKCHKVIDDRPKIKTAQEASKEAFKKPAKFVESKEISVVGNTKPKPHQPPQPHPQVAPKKKKKSKGGGNLPQQPAQPKDKNPKWGHCPICHGSVKRNGRRDKNNKRFNVIGNHFAGNRQCGGSELPWEAVIVSNQKEKYKVTIEEVTDGKL